MSYIFYLMAMVAPIFCYGVMHDIGWLVIMTAICTFTLLLIAVHLEDKQKDKIKKLEKMVNELTTRDMTDDKEESNNG